VSSSAGRSSSNVETYPRVGPGRAAAEAQPSAAGRPSRLERAPAGRGHADGARLLGQSPSSPSTVPRARRCTSRPAPACGADKPAFQVTLLLNVATQTTLLQRPEHTIASRAPRQTSHSSKRTTRSFRSGGLRTRGCPVGKRPSSHPLNDFALIAAHASATARAARRRIGRSPRRAVAGERLTKTSRSVTAPPPRGSETFRSGTRTRRGQHVEHAVARAAC
jgi:hypothetical protein